MTLDTALYANGARLSTPTPARGVGFSHDRHGVASAVAFFPGSLTDAFRLRNYPGTMELIIADGARVVWRGAVEDREVGNDGLLVQALGYSSLFSVAPYTALWSTSTSAGWREVTPAEVAVSAPGRFSMDNNKRIKIAVRNGSESSSNARGIMAYELPDRGAREAVTFSCDYSAVAFSASSYIAILRGYNDSWTQIEGPTIVDTTTTASGSFSHTFAAGVTKVAIVFARNSATPQEYTGQTDDAAVFVATNLRIKTASGTVLASDIASALYTFTNNVNPGHLQGSLITATSTDLRGELYEDERPSDILNYLATREIYEWGVNSDRVFYFRPRGSAGRNWYVDVADIRIQDSVRDLENSVYAVYTNAAGRRLRTAVASDATSIQSYGLTRRGYVSANTTSATEAEAWRAAALVDGTTNVLRASVRVLRVFDNGGAEQPGYNMLPGDNLIIRNLPQTLATDVDSLSTIPLERVEYDADTGTVSVNPRSPIPTLVTLIARRK